MMNQMHTSMSHDMLHLTDLTVSYYFHSVIPYIILILFFSSHYSPLPVYPFTFSSISYLPFFYYALLPFNLMPQTYNIPFNYLGIPLGNKLLNCPMSMVNILNVYKNSTIILKLVNDE